MSAARIVIVALLLTGALYARHVWAAPFVYQDLHYTYTTSPLVVHGLSLWLHLLNGVLLWRIVTALGLPVPGWVAALFLIHPLNIEAVAYGAAQSELLILAGLLLAVWALLERWWLAAVIPLAGLTATKVAAWPSLVTNVALAQGVSWLTWWRWDATAAWRYVALWIVPIGLTNDHDVVHVALGWQTLALIAFTGLIVAFLTTVRRWPLSLGIAVGWLLIVLLPRFAVRVPLSVLNEHHWYPVTPALSIMTASLLSRWRVF